MKHPNLTFLDANVGGLLFMKLLGFPISAVYCCSEFGMFPFGLVGCFKKCKLQSYFVFHSFMKTFLYYSTGLGNQRWPQGKIFNRK